MKSIFTILVALLPFLAISQTTTIPDPIFEQALINLEYDDVLDGSVATANINTITILDVGTQSINDLTGIEAFTSLEDLNCKGNNLTSLNVTNLTSLQFLGCHNNNLSTLDVSSLSSLSDLNCGGNNLTSLDLTNNTSLQYLTCNDNNLTSLDLSSCTLLESASIYFNENLYCVSPPEVIVFIDNDDAMSGMQGSTWFDNDEQVTFSSDCSLGGCLEAEACNTDNSALFNDGNLCIYPTTNDIYVFSYEYYEWNGETYNQTGIFDQTFTSILTGCDSTVSLHLVALVSPFETFPEVFYTTDESYLLILDELETISGAGITTENTFNPSTAGLGEHTLTVSFDASQLNEEAINTIVETSVIVNVLCNNETSSETAVSCANYLWNETNYTESGTYTYFTTSSQGCDSTVILNLTINNSTEFIAFFSSTSYEFEDISYDQSTIIEQNFTSSLGFDLTIIISITI